MVHNGFEYGLMAADVEGLNVLNQRLIGNAMRGDPTLLAREDVVEGAWCVIDSALGAGRAPRVSERGAWGPPKAASVVQDGSRWQDLVIA